MAKNKSVNNKKNGNIVNIIVIIGAVFLIGSLIYMFTKDNNGDNYITKINYNEYLEVIKKDEYSIILLTNPTCSHCNSYKPFVNYIALENNLNVYNVDLTEITYEQYIELHDRYNATKNQYNNDSPVIPTPATIIVKNGEEITSILGDIGYNGLTKLLKNYQVIK